MSKKRRTYPTEFKRSVMDLICTSRKTTAQIEHGLHIIPGLLYKWRHKYREITAARAALIVQVFVTGGI